MIESLIAVGIVTAVVVINIAIPTASIGVKFAKGQAPISWKQLPVSPYRAILSYSFNLLLIIYFTGTVLNLPQRDWGNAPEFHFPALFGHSAEQTTERPVNPPAAPVVAPEEETSSPEEPVAPPPQAEEETPPPPPSAGIGITTEDSNSSNDNDERRGRRPPWGPGSNEESDPIL